MLRLEATAAGCRWLLDRWAKLRVWLEQGADWRTNELIAALQLRGERPLGWDAIHWQGVTEPILPTGRSEPIAEARGRMLMQFADGLPDDPAGRRAALLRLVDEEVERLLRRQAGHRGREAADLAELADRLAVETAPEGELMRRYQLDNDRRLDRALNGLVKLRCAGIGVAGDPAADDAPEPEPESVGAVESQGAGADAPEGQADAEFQPKAIFDSLGYGDLWTSVFTDPSPDAPHPGGPGLPPRRSLPAPIRPGRDRRAIQDPRRRAGERPRPARRTQPGRCPWSGRGGNRARRTRPTGSWR